MVQRVGGFRRKTRSKLRKNVRDRGKISIMQYLKELGVGERVYLNAEPAVHKGMYFPRFHNKVATVINKQGRCYKVLIKDGGKDKYLVVHPVHLRKV